MEVFHFFKVALLGSEVGAVARSSRYVVRAVLKLISGRTLHQIVEYGPGDGVVTRELLKHLSPGGKFLAVDTNPGFLKILRKINDPRLQVVEGAMQDVSKNLEAYGFKNVDLVVSSIPFSYLSLLEKEEISQLTQKSLMPNGVFIIFHQYSMIMAKPLRKFFGQVKINFEIRNLLPCFIISTINYQKE